MSVALRLCASMTLLSFSGCEDKEGGERSRVRCGRNDDFGGIEKSDVVSIATDGAIVVG